VIAEAGFENLLPRHSLFHSGTARVLCAGRDRGPKRSEQLIHHGGYGSCQTGLASGTPAVIIPTYSERESNARRVAAAGAGTFVLPVEHARARKQIRAEELRAAVHRVLEDPAYTLAAKGLSQKLQAYGGAQQAARLIEDLAKTGEKDPKPDV
jgi:UDP:flavonoid glycosyltransferase YjiC (YdhE family)